MVTTGFPGNRPVRANSCSAAISARLCLTGQFQNAMLAFVGKSVSPLITERRAMSDRMNRARTAQQPRTSTGTLHRRDSHLLCAEIASTQSRLDDCGVDVGVDFCCHHDRHRRAMDQSAGGSRSIRRANEFRRRFRTSCRRSCKRRNPKAFLRPRRLSMRNRPPTPPNPRPPQLPANRPISRSLPMRSHQRNRHQPRCAPPQRPEYTDRRPRRLAGPARTLTRSSI